MGVAVKDRVLLERLREATHGLVWRSESNYPFEVFCWEGSRLSLEELIKRTGYSTDTIEILQLDRFFERVTQLKDWHDDEEAKEVQQYQNLVALLQDTLDDLVVFRLGKVEIAIYIVGTTSEGNLAGISTTAIET
ncbi:nuclease A inhibitor family protein [Oscillatoriales cyanobacterium LEGE 11467]|uniref:Nuclease A inhibitor family protein n=1 Tax=Zarconia navalis LEGE 11467 TaxID=1828826 RepID=A0A928W417_9CYAN|nr:nuclease A inhibitor family protein [Zarconia navalis]MBE9042795.1 nuclease A inhibitor family protein [Zarconia navalis LEGE 11467]